MHSGILKRIVVLVFVLAVGWPAMVHAQGAETAVRLVTQDGVTLRGVFFPADKKAPCVLIVHDLDEVVPDQQWRGLAEMLHKNGHAVLFMHLRGHGKSTEVDANVFWSNTFPANRQLVKSASKDEIAYESFDSAYYPYLINDIAAAKAFLDRRNDAGECNSANLILIGSGKGATLCAAWINAEMSRHRLMPAAFFGAPPQLAPQPEGVNILSALLVNLSPNIGRRKLALTTALQSATRRHKLPILFFSGSEDPTGKAIARETEKSINPDGKRPFTGVTEIPRAEAAGVEKRFLTDKDLQKELVRYLKQVHEERGREWESRDCREAVYYWRNPYAPASLIQVNQAGNNAPAFVGYGFFLPSR